MFCQQCSYVDNEYLYLICLLILFIDVISLFYVNVVGVCLINHSRILLHMSCCCLNFHFWKRKQKESAGVSVLMYIKCACIIIKL